jgi:hypothetical protein
MSQSNREVSARGSLPACPSAGISPSCVLPVSGKRTSNVFRLMPSKRDDFVHYFQRLTHIVRAQPGYVSANLLISLDGRHAANIGQFQTRQDFQAIFRNPRVMMGFAQGVLRRIVPGPPRLRQDDLVAVSLSDTTQMEQTR